MIYHVKTGGYEGVPQFRGGIKLRVAGKTEVLSRQKGFLIDKSDIRRLNIGFDEGIDGFKMIAFIFRGRPDHHIVEKVIPRGSQGQEIRLRGRFGGRFRFKGPAGNLPGGLTGNSAGRFRKGERGFIFCFPGFPAHAGTGQKEDKKTGPRKTFSSTPWKTGSHEFPPMIKIAL
jgi:hypothetical protein